MYVLMHNCTHIKQLTYDMAEVLMLTQKLLKVSFVQQDTLTTDSIVRAQIPTAIFLIFMTQLNAIHVINTTHSCHI